MENGMMRYATYNQDGRLTGAYIQPLLEAHAANHIEVSPEQYANWTGLMVEDVNAAVLRLVPVPGPSEATLLARNRATMWERIKARRDALSDKGGYLVTVGGVSKWFHSDGKSKTQQLGLLIAGANVPAVQWKTMDGTFVTMSQAWAAAIFAAAAAQDIAIFAAAEAHKSAMEAAANPAAYDFSGGWPAVYGDE